MKTKKLIAFAAGLALCIAIILIVAFNRSGHGSAKMVDAIPGLPEIGGEKTLWHCGMHPQVIQDHPGACPICHMALTPLKEGSQTITGLAHKPIYWWDPMLGPSSISNQPGKSAMGMELVPVYEREVSAGPKVTIDPTVVQNMGVRTEPVTRGPLNITIRAGGMLNVPEPGLHDVSLKIGGWIDRLYADTNGMHVHKGDVLFDLYSPELQVTAQELISAVHSQAALGTEAGVGATRDAQELSDSARRRLRLWDVSDPDIEEIARAERAPRKIPFRSPADGAVVEKSIVQGSAVTPGMKLLRIEDHSSLWLDAEVYEDQLSSVALGQRVEASVDAIPGLTLRGTVTFIYPHLDHMTRTELVRTRLDNPDAKLRPGMFATVQIVSRMVADAIIVPREAVIDTGMRQIAFVAEPEGHFAPRNVRMGLVGDDDKVQILAGLAPGEWVVTSGQFLMDVESRTTEAIEKLRARSTAPAPPPAMPTSNPAVGGAS